MQPNHIAVPTSLPAARRTRRAAVLSLCFAAWFAAPASAAPGVAQVGIHDHTAGETLTVHRRFGEKWIVGERGHEYSIRVHNTSAVRVLAVVSVDGVNAVTGQTAAPSQSGYVIEAGGSVIIDGWRKSLERTAAFVFTSPMHSYASRTSRLDNVGVIGVALFREREPAPLPVAEVAREGERHAATPADDRLAQKAAPASPSLGTGHGRSQYSPAGRTTFERASDSPDQLVVLRYESREMLIARGVLPRARVPRDSPDPFPAALGFVPDP